MHPFPIRHAQATLFRTMTNKYVGEVLQESIKSELEPYLSDIISNNDIWYPRELCQYLAFNTLYHTMFGDRILRDSELYTELVTDFDKTFSLTAISALAADFKFFRLFKSITEPIKCTRHRRNEKYQN